MSEASAHRPNAIAGFVLRASLLVAGAVLLAVLLIVLVPQAARAVDVAVTVDDTTGSVTDPVEEPVSPAEEPVPADTDTSSSPTEGTADDVVAGEPEVVSEPGPVTVAEDQAMQEPAGPTDQGTDATAPAGEEAVPAPTESVVDVIVGPEPIVAPVAGTEEAIDASQATMDAAVVTVDGLSGTVATTIGPATETVAPILADGLPPSGVVPVGPPMGPFLTPVSTSQPATVTGSSGSVVPVSPETPSGTRGPAEWIHSPGASTPTPGRSPLPPPVLPTAPGAAAMGPPSPPSGGSREAGVGGLSTHAAVLIAAVVLAVVLGRWLRLPADARAVTPFVSPIEQPG
jgi:hypothetical protein